MGISETEVKVKDLEHNFLETITEKLYLSEPERMIYIEEIVDYWLLYYSIAKLFRTVSRSNIRLLFTFIKEHYPAYYDTKVLLAWPSMDSFIS